MEFQREPLTACIFSRTARLQYYVINVNKPKPLVFRKNTKDKGTWHYDKGTEPGFSKLAQGPKCLIIYLSIIISIIIYVQNCVKKSTPERHFI